MKTHFLAAIAAGGLLIAGAASAQEKKIKRSALPPAVEKTVAAQSEGATIRGFSTEIEKGQTFYEAENDGQRSQQGRAYRRRPDRRRSRRTSDA